MSPFNASYGIGYSLPRSFKFAVGNTENSTQCINVTIHLNDSKVNNDDKLVLALVSLDQNAFVAVAHGYDVATVHIKDSSNCKSSKVVVLILSMFYHHVCFSYRNSLDRKKLCS